VEGFFPCPFEVLPPRVTRYDMVTFMALMSLRRFKRSRDDDAEISIIDALARLNDEPLAIRGDYTVTEAISIGETTVPMRRVPPNPPSREVRPELHITGPQPPYVNPVQRPRRGYVLLASRATLPVFHETTHVIGWSAVLPLPKRSASWAWAIRAIGMYSDKTHRVVCSQVEAARAELWERARDYDMREAEHRARHPLTSQKKM
jgi:hypothetical protein